MRPERDPSHRINVTEDTELGDKARIAILGAGNIGMAIANGLVESGRFPAKEIILTRRQSRLLDDMKQQGFDVRTSNREAVDAAAIVIVAVEPQQSYNFV